VELEPENGRGRFLLGRLLADAGELAEAEELLRGAVESSFPERPHAWHALGSVLRRTGPLDEAIQAHETGYARAPGRVDPGHVHCLLLAARLEEAIALAERAVATTRGREPWALLALARAVHLEGDRRRADELAAAARELARGSPRALADEGAVRFREGEYGEAAGAWRAAAEAEKRSPVPHPDLLEALAAQIEDAEAAAALAERWKEVSASGYAPTDAKEATLCFRVAMVRDETALAASFAEKTLELDASLGPASALFPDFARAALLAGSFEGLDAIDTTDERAAELRSLGLSWFRRILDHRRRGVREGGVPRLDALEEVAVWKVDEELSGLREDSALNRFEQEEVAAWKTFWKDVDEFHRQLMGGK
jgi:tetratricopeptide (TPR) repeat protein